MYISLAEIISGPFSFFVLIGFLIIGTLSMRDVVCDTLNPEKLFILPISFALFVFLISILGGIPIIFYRLEIVTESIFLSLPLFLGLYRSKRIRPLRSVQNKSKWSVLRAPKKMLIAFFALAFLFIVLLLIGKTGAHVLTPWNVVHPFALWVVLILTIIVLWSIFSPMKRHGVLVLLIVYSFVLHAYIPITYDGGFGGDRWRHIASEKYLLTGEVYTPSLIGEKEIPLKTIAGVTVPEVFIAGNKSSYAPQWILTIFTHQMTGISLEGVDQWLVPLVWFWLIILCVYEISRFLFQDQRWRLFLTFIPITFFPYQVYGGITIPVGFGQLSFLFILWAWLRYVSIGDKKSKYFGLIAILLGYFHYILHFLLSIILAILALIQRSISKRKKSIDAIILIVSIVLLAALIPLLEQVFGLSWFTESLASPESIFQGLADAFGRITNLVGYTHYGSHIGQGNFLYEASRLPTSRVSFLRWPYWPLAISLIIYGTSAIGFWSVLRKKANEAWRCVSAFLVVLSLSYFVSWFVMDGYRTLARRLDLSIALFVSFLFVYGCYSIMGQMSKITVVNKVAPSKMLIVLMIAGVSFATTSTFASGPILDRVTKSEYLASQYIWEKIQNDTEYCVVANTWPLLGLEAASGRTIIGGGFPVYKEYAQPERVKIFETLSKYPTQELFLQALSATEAQRCVYMTEFRFINSRVLAETENLLGPPEKQIGEVFIWIYDRFTI
ncbi:MAG: hypothetical protein HOA84_04530 [Candidatus Jacksonbacteria bacterium]|nr:hypothetical protein [Candidatus Jacksonbacteria bacterium]